MPSNRPRFVQAYEPDVMASDRRIESYDVPAFSLDGPVYESQSAPFMAEKTLILVRWYAVSGVAAELDVSDGPSTFALVIGDTDLYRGGQTRAKLTLAKGQRYNSADLGSSVGKLVLTARQWVRIDCLVGGGHESVTVKIEAEVM